MGALLRAYIYLEILSCGVDPVENIQVIYTPYLRHSTIWKLMNSGIF